MKIKPQYLLLTLANTNNVNYDCSKKAEFCAIMTMLLVNT